MSDRFSSISLDLFLQQPPGSVGQERKEPRELNLKSNLILCDIDAASHCLAWDARPAMGHPVINCEIGAVFGSGGSLQAAPESKTQDTPRWSSES